MSDSESKVKVTDKRMFTSDGELREDFRHLEKGDGEEDGKEAGSEATESAAESPRAEEPEPRAPSRPSAGGSRIVDPATGEEPAAAAGPAFGSEPAADATRGQPGSGASAKPGFLDLVTLLAQPIPLYLGDAQLEGEGSMENLDAARFYIDLLEVLQEKTAGNCSAEESALLEDLLYRLRLRYVQKTR